MDRFYVCLILAAVILYKPLNLKGEDGRWILHNKFCYYFPRGNDVVEGAGARRKCRDLGSGVDLLSIQTEEENIFIMENKGNIDGAWMGLITDIGCNSCKHSEENDACMDCRNSWRWYDNRRYSYQNWEPNKPDDSAHKCGRLFNNGQWRNAHCNSANRHHSICKRKDPCSSSPCINGTCLTQCANGEYTCTCESGFTGRRCQTSINDCQQDACNERGECIDGHNSFTCQCKSGYTGEHCETDINECMSNACNGRGECSDGINSFTCQCNTGYTGEHCETDIDHCLGNRCLNDATCLDGLEIFTCQCLSGFTGTHCETDIDECSVESIDDNCLHGNCSNTNGSYNCTCFEGYTGKRCHEELSTNSNKEQEDDLSELWMLLYAAAPLAGLLLIVTMIMMISDLRNGKKRAKPKRKSRENLKEQAWNNDAYNSGTSASPDDTIPTPDYVSDIDDVQEKERSRGDGRHTKQATDNRQPTDVELESMYAKPSKKKAK